MILGLLVLSIIVNLLLFTVILAIRKRLKSAGNKLAESITVSVITLQSDAKVIRDHSKEYQLCKEEAYWPILTEQAAYWCEREAKYLKEVANTITKCL